MASDIPAHSRPLGATEDNWTKSTAGGTGIVAFGALLNRALDLAHVSGVTKELLDRHILLRAQIVENAKGKICLQSAAAASSASQLVLEKPWPNVDDVDHDGVLFFPDDHHDKHGSLALHKIVSQELNVGFVNPEGKPLPPLNVFRVHSYPNSSRHQTIVVLKFHSGALDRQSACLVAQEFLSCLNSAVEGRPSVYGAGGDALLQAIEDFIPKGKASKGLLQKGMDAVNYAYNAKRHALLPFNPSYNASNKPAFQSDVVTASLGKEATASLFAACKKENITYAAALCAAILKTAADVKELKEKKQDEFSFTCVLDCRAMLEPKLAEAVLGNYSLGIPQNGKVKGAVEFWDFARQVADSIEKDLGKSKQFSEMPVLAMLFSQVMKHPSMTPNSTMRTNLFTLFVDGPMEAQWKGVRELGLVGTLGPFSSMHFVGPCVCVGEALLQGPELLLSFIFPSPVFSRSQILTFLRSSIQLLNDNTRHHS